MAQLTDLLNNIRKGNYKDANATIFDSLYLKIEESIEDKKEMSEASHDKDGDEYKKFFQSALKKFGVTSPGGLEGDKKKEFYNYVDKNWKSDKEKETGQDDPKESFEVEEGAEMDIAKEKEKMASSQEKIRDFAIKMKKEKQRKKAEA